MTEGRGTAGLRVLVVEDDYLVAKALSLTLRAIGCEVVGPVSTAEQAIALIRSNDVDAAILDVRLAPGTSAPIARTLLMRSAPFAFVTGYSEIDILPDELRGYRVLHKPVDQATLKSAVDEMARRLHATRE